MNKYSREFKEQTVQLSDEIGVRKTGKDLGFPRTLTDWKKVRSAT